MLSAPLCVTPKHHHHLVHNLATTSQCAYVFMCAGFVYIYTPIRADGVAVVRWRVCTRARARALERSTQISSVSSRTAQKHRPPPGPGVSTRNTCYPAAGSAAGIAECRVRGIVRVSVWVFNAIHSVFYHRARLIMLE